MGVVAPAQAHLPVLEAHQAVVGDGHTMGVAAQIGQHLLGTGERRFGIHYPVGVLEGGEPAAKGCGVGQWGCGAGEVQLTVLVGLGQCLEILGAEHRRECAHRKQEPGLGGDPALAIGAQGSAGDHAVDMDVLIELLAPGVQDHGDAELPAEPARIAAKFQQRL